MKAPTSHSFLPPLFLSASQVTAWSEWRPPSVQRAEVPRPDPWKAKSPWETLVTNSFLLLLVRHLLLVAF